MNNTYSIDFTEQQIKVLVELINIAVKTVGLEAARPAVELVNVIQSAIQPAGSDSSVN